MNLDYVYRVPHFVAPGETLAAEGQSLNPGGKGLNQSIALARAGAAVCHAGCVGAGGEQLAALLRENGAVSYTHLDVYKRQAHLQNGLERLSDAHGVHAQQR